MELPSSASSPAVAPLPRRVPYLGQRSPASIIALARLVERQDLCLVPVVSLDGMVRILQEEPGGLVLVGPELPAAKLPEVLARVASLRPEPPVVVVRESVDDVPECWSPSMCTVNANSCPAPVASILIDQALSSARPTSRWISV